MNWIKSQISKPFFPLILALIAFLDYFLFLIPISALLVSSTLASRKRWFSFALATLIGSSLGGILFCLAIAVYGVPFIDRFAPAITGSTGFQMAARKISHYGFLAVFFFCAVPLSEHAALVGAALAKMNFIGLSVSIGLGKMVKFFTLGYVATRTIKSKSES